MADFAARHLAELVRELQTARRDRSLSQRAVSARLGMAEIIVGGWEVGANLPSTPAFIRWAHALDRAVQILDRTGRPAVERPMPRHLEDIELYELRRIAATLKRMRLELGHTQDAVGALLDTSEWTVRMWETDRRQPRILHLISWSEAVDCRLTLGEL
jgi:DNA-binding transcriptional regulator YiaG